jgi:hypothetical protein
MAWEGRYAQRLSAADYTAEQCGMVLPDAPERQAQHHEERQATAGAPLGHPANGM